MLGSGPFSIQDEEENLDKDTSHVPNIIVVLLVTEIVVFISLLAFYSPEGSNSNLFYLFTLGYIMLWSVYFAWHSLVKENGFELLAFLFLSTLTNAEGIFFLFSYNISPIPKYLFLTYFILMTIAYPLLCYHCYHHFGLATIHKLSSTSEFSILKSIRDYELFISSIQIAFMFNSLILFTFLYYITDDWKSFSDIGTALSILGFLIIISHSCLGIWSATKENIKGLKSFLILLPIIHCFIGWMILETELSPSKHIYYMLFEQEVLIEILNILCLISLAYLGYKNFESFGKNRYSLIKHTNNTFIKSIFI